MPEPFSAAPSSYKERYLGNLVKRTFLIGVLIVVVAVVLAIYF